MIKLEVSDEVVVLEKIRGLLIAGVDVTILDILGDPSVVRAINLKMYSVAILLIQNGADLGASCSADHACTSLSAVFCTFNKDLIEVALKSESFKSLPKFTVYQAFVSFCKQYAILGARGDVSLVSFILDSSEIDLSTCGDVGEPIIFHSIDDRAHSLVNLFLSKGVDLTVKNSTGLTPIEYAKAIYSNLGYDSSRWSKKLLISIISSLESFSGFADKVIYMSSSHGLVTAEPYVAGLEDGWVFNELDGEFSSFLTNEQMKDGYPKLGRNPVVLANNQYHRIADGDYIVTAFDGSRFVVNADVFSKDFTLVGNQVSTD